jgi:hypothetical protein
MKIDMRREARHVWREFARYQRVVGETVVWFRFDPINSRYDDIYDEGGAKFYPGVRMPVEWVDQIEDPEQSRPEGRRSTQRIRFSVSVKMMAECGVVTTEAHGRRIWDPEIPPPGQVGRPNPPWLDERINDVIFYDGRYYSVSNFQIRGRLQGLDVIIGVSGIEMIPSDEEVFDFFPADQTYT